MKWVIVPLVLAALGVFGVGPYLNKAHVPIVEHFKPQQPPNVVPVEEQASDQNKYGEPKVEVTVAPGGSSSTRHEGTSRSRTRHRRRHRHKHKPATPPADAGPGNGTSPSTPPDPGAPG
jgi:hypothetical protein